MTPFHSILTPTDFSGIADNALGYAAAIARMQDAELSIMHVSDRSDNSPNTDGNHSTGQDLEKISLDPRYNSPNTDGNHSTGQDLEKISLDPRLSGIRCQFIREYGRVISRILTQQQKQQADLIVMGTNGADAFGRVLFGTNTSSVIKQALCPVLAVPADVPYQQFRKVVVATDMRIPELEKTASVIPLIRAMQSALIILHVDPAVEERIETVYQLSEADRRILEHIDYPDISMYVSSYKDVNAGIQAFVEQKHADLLVMITHHRNLIQSLFDSSKTGKMVLHTRIPLLAVPA